MKAQAMRRVRRARWICLGWVTAATALACCGQAQAQAQAKAAPAPLGQPAAASAEAASASSFGSLGVALYPGMVTVIAAHRRPVAKRGKMVSATFRSADRPEQIAAFYRSHLGRWFGPETQFVETLSSAGVNHLQASTGESQAIEVAIRSEGAQSIVSIQALVNSH